MLDDAIAAALIAGQPDAEGVFQRLSRLLGRPWRWLRPFAARYSAAFGAGVRPRHSDALCFTRADAGYRGARRRLRGRLLVRDLLIAAPEMQPAPAAAGWNVPAIVTAAELADWLSLDMSELEWFADLNSLERKARDARLRHYHYRVIAKSSGSVRLIEAPKPRLKQLQRRILDELLSRVPEHPAAHGFVPGRSTKTFAAPHAGRQVVVRMDLRNFFPSITRARIQALFRTAGYPEPVADLLGGLCTNSAPRDVWNPLPARDVMELYGGPHLPQGAPTSPALANLCAYRLDARLTGLAAACGATYSRYADDLAFSGDADFARRAGRFTTHAAAILMEEGFSVHHRKTRVMRQGVRQHLAGIVVNHHMNVIRADFDALKAALTNCLRHGPETQNHAGHADFRAHLDGRISYVTMIHPERGAKLRAIFQRISWK